MLLEAGQLTLATTYINAQRARVAIKDAFKQAMKDVDVLVTPTQPTTALKIGQTTSRIGAREESVFGVSNWLRRVLRMRSRSGNGILSDGARP
jgi:Asp-tRNA(Asn)/Glu-tRNA(Gln) amidotransferase A subunit family amidase